ncbi:MAG: TonB-dependent receptor [Arenicella sp.]|jgi:TonB-dependent receptor
MTLHLIKRLIFMKPNHVVNNKAKLAIAVAIAISGNAHAQTTDDQVIEEIKVYGSRAALVNALDRQRASDKTVGVIDSDSMGDFADINVSESLRRISGIMVENDQGEGRYVSVRGMNSDLNAMTINGVSTASPEDRRGIMLDGVPTDMLQSMTVYKTLTPNLDADTIGGAIDLETISAFSRDDMHLRLKAETSYNQLTKDANNPNLAATWTNRFKIGEDELGVALVVSDQSRRIIAHNNENGGWSDVAPNDDYELRYYDMVRAREGVVLNFDYKTANGNSYFAHMFHNEYTDSEYRAKWETRDGLEDNAPIISGNTFTYANTKMDTEVRDRVEVRTIDALRLGAEFAFDNGSILSVEAFGSQAKQDDGDKLAAIFRSKKIDQPVIYDNSSTQRPALTIAPAFFDPSSFDLKAFERESSLTTDKDFGIKADMVYDVSDSTTLQFGFKVRQREKQNEFNYCGYEPINEASLADFETRTIDPYLNSVHGPAPTAGTVRGFLNNLGAGNTTLSDGTSCPDVGSFFEFSGDEEEESVPADWKTQEDIVSTYLMATTEKDNVSIVYGLRYEDTNSTYRGNIFDGDGFSGESEFNSSHGFLAPSFNLKYAISDNQVGRFSVFRSLVRPGFNESRAASIRDIEDNEIEGGNPQLEPTTAISMDLSYEHYINDVTFVGAGVFYKSIDDAVVEVSANNFDLLGNTWDRAETFVNAGNSKILGLEFSLQTAWDNGLLAVLNYTYVDGETDLPANSAFGERTISYFKQADSTANLSFGYDKGPLDVRLAVNYRSEYLDEVGDDAESDRFTSPHMQVDLNAKYKISDNLQLSFAVININDRPEYYYFGDKSRLSQYDEYGTTFTAGARYTF